jgi:hypothetical protein
VEVKNEELDVLFSITSEIRTRLLKGTEINSLYSDEVLGLNKEKQVAPIKASVVHSTPFWASSAGFLSRRTIESPLITDEEAQQFARKME